MTERGRMPSGQPDLRRPGSDSPPTGPRPRIDGYAADGLVTVTVSTAGELLGVHVDPGEYHPHDAPGLENMGDMVVEALIDAKARAIAFTQGFSGFAESPAG